MNQPDWNQLKAFLETAETGSLSAAARKLGLTQPTLSRQVAAIERQMGVTLFERVGKSMSLTPTGLELLEHARAMGAAAEALSLAATGRSQAVGGVVSVSATDAVCSARHASSLAASAASLFASIDAASNAALTAPALPIANVPTGIPAGICTIDNKLSIPSSAFDCTGTPSTGNRVIDAAMPGKWAAPPAPAMIQLRPRATALLA